MTIMKNTRVDYPAALQLILFLFLLFWAMSIACAAEKDFEVIPKWVRPGGSITLRIGPEIDISKKMFLRLSGRSAIKDLPLDTEQMVRRIVEVRIPAVVGSGKYDTSLVDEAGRDLGVYGSGLKIAASNIAEDKPVITKLVPVSSYPKHGRYDFDIRGENFGADVRGIKILINDTAFTFDDMFHNPGGETLAKECRENSSCLVLGWKTLNIRGLSLTGQQIIRPMAISVAVDGIESNNKTIILSPVDRTMPVIIAFVTLAVLMVLVYFISRRKAALHQVNGRSYSTLAFLFMDPKTNAYSLSQFQLILWLAAAVLAYSYLAASRALVQWDWRLCEFPENLPTLLGISAGTTVLSIGTTSLRGSKGAGQLHPDWADFICSGGVFAPERLQFFLWTVIGVFSFISATLAQDPSSVTDLPRIPDSFIPLMGMSSVGYLAGKVTRKPGPIITRIDPMPNDSGSTALRIQGEYFSPRAQVTLNGTLLQKEEVAAVPHRDTNEEFVMELIVTPKTFSFAAADKNKVKIVNPDGQSAES